MSDPVPQPDGRLGPPDRHPPTAVGVATPPPPRPPRPARVHGGPSPLLRSLRRGVDALLDAADVIGDAIRGAVGLHARPAPREEVRRVEPPE